MSARHPLDIIVLGRDPCRRRGLPDLPEVRSLWRLYFWHGFWTAFGGDLFEAEMGRRQEVANRALALHCSVSAQHQRHI